jgi:Fe-S cluster assembly iron-binding protein IscA
MDILRVCRSLRLDSVDRGEDIMVKVTNTALLRLKRKLKRQPEGVAVRITVHDGHVQFRPDTEQNGDVVFSQSGQTLLLVGAETAEHISNRTLGVVKTVEGDRLRFVRPA